MTKADIVNEVSLATGMPKKEVGIVVEAFMDAVKEIGRASGRARV